MANKLGVKVVETVTKSSKVEQAVERLKDFFLIDEEDSNVTNFPKIKYTKKFNRMHVLERVVEGTKMFFFGDSVAQRYCDEVGYYNYLMKNQEQNEGNLVSMDAMLLKRKLIEDQKLLAKYNCEDLILGHEIVDKNDEEYQQVIEPYKVSKGKRRIFESIF